ncbi:MAG: SulP family inorganic anion transporter [Actinomycetota bacterium]
MVAGLTLVAIAVPEQMATARLANLPAITGLYAFVAGSLMIALFGSTPQMSVGADSTIAPVFAAGVASVAVAGSPQYLHMVTFLALIVGLILLAVGLFKLGWIADFISTPVVTGILAGIALEIFVRQIPAILGLPGGGAGTAERLQRVYHQLGRTNGWALAIAAVVLVLIVGSERINHRIPGALLGLVVSIVAVGALGLKSRVQVLGAIPAGLPALGLPAVRLQDALHLAATALTVAFVCVVQTAATSRSLGPGKGATDNLNRDLVGLGAGNLLTGLSSSFPVNSSPPRSAVVAASGGRSQLASLVAVATTVLVVAAATGVLASLPQATLGAILIFVATRLLHVKDLAEIRRFDAVEFGLALATIAAVVLLGIEQGVVVAFVLSLADRTRLAARPQDAVLGREIGTDHWIPPTSGRHTEQVPGVLVYLLHAPLWFGNAQRVTERIRHLIDDAAHPIRWLVLDAAGVSDIDFTGARALDGLVKELKQRDITVGVARASGLVPKALSHSSLLTDIGTTRVYSDVESAVSGLSDPAAGHSPGPAN